MKYNIIKCINCYIYLQLGDGDGGGQGGNKKVL